MVNGFGGRLLRAIESRGPLCVGIDAHPQLLDQWGLPDTVDGLARFCATVVEALAGEVAVLKPQSAFFERFGSAGVAVLESTIRQSRDAGALVIVDAKRGDIGSTAQAYAQAYLDQGSPLYADAVTVSPYLGFGSISGMVDAAHRGGAGLFVLALTSNPEGAQVQHAKTADGRTVAQTIIDEVGRTNAGRQPLGSIGVVVGATTGSTGHDLSGLNGPVLAPGLGAQGAAPGDLAVVFAGLSGVVLPSYSREVLMAGPGKSVIRAAAGRAVEQCRKVLKYPDL